MKEKQKSNFELDVRKISVSSFDSLLEQNKPSNDPLWEKTVKEASTKFKDIGSDHATGWILESYRRQGGRWVVSEDTRQFNTFFNRDEILKTITPAEERLSRASYKEKTFIVEIYKEGKYT
jgi:hypothetical protein